ncbi:MAG: cadmium-translocating P-type ATPase [Chlamydiae bacterium RIFCSPHIGHO2_12_FULL_44_59]|nr:MAG: cadmium-translocating P-type ATPase [Chlamydiae bacterium RIFCSPHIGHO2_01_FULL_44_39]OGN59771.1 MAG: cadmium-translocating P-type ATPase [Chlamydiae bacterium RIFCSPHIGHO2_12_FULL_44_59]OGN65869.1 MAG: cadmium-translocating P-type ATPase [Chlamydiae bacterium RIFCSPLOWO2_01_FULL_44_52]OGN68279.1 MAG: cadmium-translocating P-type ATPase [Chlamydiae bacterium RIFCSPLOWO2_02_FULL_45_22]OGN69589.1 MAG: cadmium-translocating P-type ATPase [Chlamydiae bacterium RIFCSPLOWO2_12_FULL_45_20]
MKPYVFDEFFSSGRAETISPFLTPTSRKWGKHLSLRSALLSLTLLAFAFSFSWFSRDLSLLFLLMVYFLSGTPALINSLHDLKNLELNIDVLMTLAAFVAVAIDSALEGALLLVLFELSHGMEDAVSSKARSALHNLNHIAPKFAHMLDQEGIFYEKSVREIQVGEILFVKNGEIIPLDGVIIQGTSSLNLVHLTGESLPISKTIGDTVPAGARNLEAALTIQVTKTSSDSTLSRVVKLITEAQEAKPRLQQWLDRFGKRYATSIIALTFLFAIGLPFLRSMSYFGHEGALYRALAFLIAASPCALIIATPTAYLSAISASARKGILLKGGMTLDALASCNLIAFDKTGTLTTGQLQCKTTDIPDDMLAIAYGLERNVVHPIATAICHLAQEKRILPAVVTEFRAIPGFGMEGIIDGEKAVLGRPKKHAKRGVLAFLEYRDQTYLFEFSDQVRENMQELIQSLPLQAIMLTGDHEASAQTVAQAVGIDQVFANLLPEDKLDKVALLSEQGLAMVGDGINDAPALARATVGISLGRIGSATAVDASDVVLLTDDLHQLTWLFKKSKKTGRIVKENITLALLVILLTTTPALLGYIPLWLAVILHEGGTVLVGLNSLRLLR